MAVNDSFFLPTLTPKKAFTAVSRYYSKKKYRMTYVERIESGMLGIRVWRVV